MIKNQLYKTHLTGIIKHPLISGSSIVFIGGFIASLINYFFNLIMGRLLTKPDYGLLASLSSLFILGAFFSVAFGNVITRFTAKYHGAENREGEAAVLRIGAKYVTLSSCIVLLLLLALTPLISDLLHVDNSLYVILIAFASFFNLMLSLPYGYIQGKLWFVFLSIVAIVQPLIKIIIGLLLIYLGFSLFGPFIGILLASAIPSVVLFYYFFKRFRQVGVDTKTDAALFKKEFTHFSYVFFLSGIGFTIIQNTDIMLVRHFFSPDTSGLYAAIAAMGKAIFYFTNPINAVFFPLITYRKEKQQRLFHIVLLASGLMALISGAISLFYFMFPDFVLKVFFPSSPYQEATIYLGYFSLYMVILSLVNLFNNFYLSIGKTNVYKVTLLAALLQVCLIIVFHQTLFQVIHVMLSVAVVLLISYLLYYLRFVKD